MEKKSEETHGSFSRGVPNEISGASSRAKSKRNSRDISEAIMHGRCSKTLSKTFVEGFQKTLSGGVPRGSF